MGRKFNVTGACIPQYHYMVNLDSRLAQIKEMIDDGQYFCINRGRQYGKTTILKALKNYLSEEYIVVSMDFQSLSAESFKTEKSFVKAFVSLFLGILEFSEYQNIFQSAVNLLNDVADMPGLFKVLSYICRTSDKALVLIIDEVDQASNNQIFLDFLAQLRSCYLTRYETPTFQSVILAGVHDVRNLKQKIRLDEEHKHNSPWNIASRFDVEMSFSPDDIARMLSEYEKDHTTGMAINNISQLIYDYTSGYPVLVSSICNFIDRYDLTWTTDGVSKAFKKLITERNPLFESLINKLEDDEKLRNLIYSILFQGQKYLFNSYASAISSAMMYGFLKNDNGTLKIANRAFEMVIYDWFISIETTESPIFTKGVNEKSRFIEDNRLDMEKVLERFVVHFNDIYGGESEKFKEDDGRKLFLLYLRPIINGVGNYYIEAQTRDHRRTDIVVDYAGQQYIIELKIWHGDEYNAKGEQQLSDYLDSYHLDKGYLVTFSFLKDKHIGVKTVRYGDKTIVEATV